MIRDYLDSNLMLLRRQQPDLERVLRAFDPTYVLKPGEVLEVRQAKNGLAVPVLNGHALHSLEDPAAEGEALARSVGLNIAQSRLLFFGFAFGYHLLPFIKAGLSPIVYEPSLALLWLAFSQRDLSQIIPFTAFHTGQRPPDVPRGTVVLTFQKSAELFPRESQMLAQKIIPTPSKTDDLEGGIYYESYRNVTCLKNPCDMVVYQMIFMLVRPTLVLEIGACRGGSALYFADLLRIMGGFGRIHTYDIVDEVPAEVINDPLITLHTKGWTEFDPTVIRPDDRVLIIEDSSHTYENTIAVLNHFAPYVTPNSYFLVEDGAAGYVRPDFNGGAIRALEEFIPEHHEFEVDTRWEYFFGNGSSNRLSCNFCL